MCWCTPSIRTPFCGKPDCHPTAATHQQLSEEEAFIDQYDHVIARRIARQVYRSRKGLQAGMPKVTLDSYEVENLLSRWKVSKEQAQ